MLCNVCGVRVVSGPSGVINDGMAFCYAHLSDAPREFQDEPDAPSFVPVFPPRVGKCAAKRSAFAIREINPNPIRRGSHELAKTILTLVGIKPSKTVVARIRDRIVAVDVRRVTPEVFKLEFSQLMSAFSATLTVEHLDAIFGMVYRPQLPMKINSSAGLARTIVLFLGSSDPKKIEAIRMRLVGLDTKHLNLHAFKNEFGAMLRSDTVDLSPTGEDLREIYKLVNGYLCRKSNRRPDYSEEMTSTGFDAFDISPLEDDPETQEWVGPFLRLQAMQLKGTIHEGVTLQQLFSVWSGEAPSMSSPYEDDEIREIAGMSPALERRCPRGTHIALGD